MKNLTIKITQLDREKINLELTKEQVNWLYDVVKTENQFEAHEQMFNPITIALENEIHKVMLEQITERVI